MNKELAQTAAEFYADILDVLSKRTKDADRYVRLNRLFLHLLEEHTAQLPVHLVGPFAKTDYLLKERGASKKSGLVELSMEIPFEMPHYVRTPNKK